MGFRGRVWQPIVGVCGLSFGTVWSGDAGLGPSGFCGVWWVLASVVLAAGFRRLELSRSSFDIMTGLSFQTASGRRL